MWRLVLQLENHPTLLKEYGRAIAILTNVEYELRIAIIARSNESQESLEAKTLGQLIGLAKNHISDTLYNNLDDLNKKRKVLIHGVVEWHWDGEREGEKRNLIAKDGQEHELNTKFLTEISEFARKIAKELIDLNFQHAT